MNFLGESVEYDSTNSGGGSGLTTGQTAVLSNLTASGANLTVSGNLTTSGIVTPGTVNTAGGIITNDIQGKTPGGELRIASQDGVRYIDLKNNENIDVCGGTLNVCDGLNTNNILALGSGNDLKLSSNNLTKHVTLNDTNITVVGDILADNIKAKNLSDFQIISSNGVNFVTVNDTEVGVTGDLKCTKITASGSLKTESANTDNYMLADNNNIGLYTPSGSFILQGGTILSSVATLDINASTKIDFVSPEVKITGNLTVDGTTTTVDTETVTISDPMIKLGDGNLFDTKLTGLYSQYQSDGATKYAGLVHSAGNNYYMYSDMTTEPTDTTLGPNFVYDGTLGYFVDTNEPKDYDTDIVKNGAIGSVLNVGNIRCISDLNPNKLPSLTVATRDAIGNPENGSVFFNQDSSTIDYWTGYSWVSLETKQAAKECKTGQIDNGGALGLANYSYNGNGAFSPDSKRIYWSPNARVSAASWHYVDTAIPSDYKVVEYTHGGGVSGAGGGKSGCYYDSQTRRIWLFSIGASSLMYYLDDTKSPPLLGSIPMSSTPGGTHTDACYVEINGERRLYLIPASQLYHPVFYYINLDTNVCHEYANQISGFYPVFTYPSQGGAFHQALGRIYIAPFDLALQTQWYYIDVTDNTVHTYAHNLSVQSRTASGAVYHPITNELYFVPYGQAASANWVRINEEGVPEFYPGVNTGLVDGYEYAGFNYASNEVIFCPKSISLQTVWHKINSSGVMEPYSHGQSTAAGYAFAYTGLSTDTINNRAVFTPFGAADQRYWLTLDC